MKKQKLKDLEKLKFNVISKELLTTIKGGLALDEITHAPYTGVCPDCQLGDMDF